MISSVFGLTDWQFWLNALIFGSFVWFVLRGLGFLWIRTSNTTSTTLFSWLTQQAILITLGFASFVLMGFIFAKLDLRVLQWVLIGIGVIGSIIHSNHDRKIKILRLDQSGKVTLSLVAAGVILQLTAIAGSGIKQHEQIRFFFTNAQDGMMHLAFARSLVETFPPVRPEISSQQLTNYHYFTDLLIAEQARLFSTPIAHAFFQYWPVLLSLLAGIFVAASIKELTSDSKAQWLGIGIWYCSGELSYIWNLLLHQSFNWNIATIENSADQFLNMPQMFAKVLIFAAYYTAIRWFNNQEHKHWFFSTLLLVIVSTGFKVYFGLYNLILLISLICMGILAKKIITVPRRHFFAAVMSLTLPLILAVLAVATLFIAVSTGDSHLSWVPLAWPKLLLSAEHLNFSDWWLRMQVYEAAHSWKGILALNSIAILIALMSMVGTKLAGIWLLRPSKEQYWWQLPLLMGSIGMGVIGLNTLQTPGGFNTYNFIIVAIQPLVILTALALAKWWKQSLQWKLLVVFVLIAGSFRPIANYIKYFSAQINDRADARYTVPQITALTWIVNHTNDTAVIQALPTNQQNQQSAFVSFFAQRTTFLAAENITVSHNLDYKLRDTLLKSAVAVTDWQTLRANLAQLGIDYIYVDKNYDQEFLNAIPGLLEHSVYQNETTVLIAL